MSIFAHITFVEVGTVLAVLLVGFTAGLLSATLGPRWLGRRIDR
jgi:hypothetical protein